MDSSRERTERGSRTPDKRKVTALGLAYLLVGIGFFYSLATNSVELLTAVLAGVVGLIVLSLAIVVRREGLFTAENKVLGGFVLVAMGLLFGLSEYTDLASEIVYGVVFTVGVVLPHLVLQYTQYGSIE